VTTRTRRRLILCALLAIFTLPAEALVMPVLRNPDPAVAARGWVASLGADQLQQASFDIHAYPYLYRRALMAALSPEERAQVWQRHFRDFLNAHPDLDGAQRGLISRAVALSTPDVFSGSPAPGYVQDQLTAAYVAAMTLLGKATARELFIRLGPDPGSSDELPLSVRVSDALRSYFVAHAGETPDCDCADVHDCDVPSRAACSEAVSCTADTDYPMCGPLWCYACTGTCQVRAGGQH
jgi:diadenosine tetraphosphatase ApaH/serine/threonine PP2A family protein phosphatase